MKVTWSQLSHAAIVGTRKATVPPVDGLNAVPSGQDAAHTLLRQAGVLDWYERAGRVIATQLNPLPEPPVDDTPICSAAASQLLSQMLDGQYRELLPRYLDAMATAGQRVPPQYLPNLLQYGQRASIHRPIIIRAIGKSGQWLAQRNPAWHYAAPLNAGWRGLLTHWRQLDVPARQGLLRQVRQADPALGRELLQANWKQEPDSSRAGYLRCLEHGLSIDDEQLLERALDDRVRPVRLNAAELLAQIPNSRLQQRMSAHGDYLLGWLPQQSPTLLVRMPRLSAALGRDGVTIKSKKKKSALVSEQVRQIVGAVPLSFWTEKWSVSAETIVRQFAATTWPRTLTAAFTLAARRQQDQTWIRALLFNLPLSNVLLPLVPRLDSAQLAPLLAKSLHARSATAAFDRKHPFAQVMSKWAAHWPDDVAWMWLDLLEQQAAMVQTDANGVKKTPLPSDLKAVQRKFAQYVPLALQSEVEARLGQLPQEDNWRKMLTQTVRTLAFRQQLAKSLEADA